MGSAGWVWGGARKKLLGRGVQEVARAQPCGVGVSGPHRGRGSPAHHRLLTQLPVLAGPGVPRLSPTYIALTVCAGSRPYRCDSLVKGPLFLCPKPRLGQFS